MKGKLIVSVIMVMLLAGLGKLASHYHSKYTYELDRADKAESLAATRQATISDIQARQKSLAELDERHTQELADAKKTISALERDVSDGRKRLRINATCPGVPQNPTAPGVDDATSPRLSNAAQRDYFTLRERHAIATQQIEGLQDYISTQCLK